MTESHSKETKIVQERCAAQVKRARICENQVTDLAK